MSSMQGGHKRSAGAVSFQMDDGPTSTTKAMMVSIVVPRFVATSKTDDSDDNDDKTAAATLTNNAVPKAEPKKPEKPKETIGAVSSVERKSEEAERKIEEKPSMIEMLAQSIKEGEDEDDEEEEEEEVTAEEAAHVIVSNHDPDETEVNVEALLRLTLKTLLVEWHLLTVPTFTTTNQQLAQQLDPDIADRPRDAWVQVQFMARPTSLAVVLDRLERIGVGSNCGSLTVYRAELCRTTSAYAQAPIEEEEFSPPPPGGDEDDNDGTIKYKNDTPSIRSTARNGKLTPTHEESEKSEAKMTERMIEAAKMEWKNAATRLRIEQVREQISEQAALTFDFIALLAIASILAGVGLITDNTVVIVASMLVSPIMGPVLGLTFGSRIKDWPLVISSLLNETLALLGCVIIGALVGLGAGFTNLASETWPTNEMQIRGEPLGLITGIAIAIPSGMGVCLSVLGGNTSSLVGVAISASLLPPAVNAGVCFVYSFFLAIGAVESEEGKSASDFAVIGATSFALTALNIVCIWISGLLMFEIKEVTPQKKKSAFWAKDIKVARELNKGSEQPPPVDISLIKQGIQSALNKEQQNAEPGERIVFGPHLMYGPHAPRHLQRTSSKILDTDTFPPMSPTQVGRKKIGEGGGLSGLFSSLFFGFDGASAQKEEEPDDNIRFVGLEDMGALMGFDVEDDDYDDIDYAQVVQHIGKGRYI